MVAVRMSPRAPIKGRHQQHANKLLFIFVVAALVMASFIVVLSVDDEEVASLDYSLSHIGSEPSLTKLKDTASSRSDVTLPKKTEKQKREKKKKKVEEEEDLGTWEPEPPAMQPPSPYHIVFSTGCSIYQDWQSYVFFYHVIKSGQQGHITRIASGCKDHEKRKLQRVWEEDIQPMAPGRLHLHYTPEYKKSQPGTNYKYFNKPKGMQHWMRNALGYPTNHTIHDDSIVILMDPDQILIRPFTNDFSNSSEIWRLKEERLESLKVTHGAPFAQQYGFGIQWKRKVDPEYVFQGPSNITSCLLYTSPSPRD